MAGFDIHQIDEVIHGRMRLGVMAYLIDADVAEFTELKHVLKATQGNLSIHLGKLEAAGYIAMEKRFRDRKSLTEVRLTDAGRAAFADYLQALAKLILPG
ncbi:MAG: winged helix-turn-helix domain-containing protein [Pseudomonadota bacterium]